MNDIFTASQFTHRSFEHNSSHALNFIYPSKPGISNNFDYCFLCFVYASYVLLLFVKQALSAPKVFMFEEDEILVLEFGEILPHGVGVLELGFNGVLNDKMKGFYRR